MKRFFPVILFPKFIKLIGFSLDASRRYAKSAPEILHALKIIKMPIANRVKSNKNEYMQYAFENKGKLIRAKKNGFLSVSNIGYEFYVCSSSLLTPCRLMWDDGKIFNPTVNHQLNYRCSIDCCFLCFPYLSNCWICFCSFSLPFTKTFISKIYSAFSSVRFTSIFSLADVCKYKCLS